MLDYLPSTRRLLDLLVHPKWGNPSDPKEAADPYPVDAALSEWENDVLSELPIDQYKKGIWPSTPELLSALAEALQDQRGNYAGERLAFALAHCGCHTPDVISSLNPWDALAFHWCEAGYSAEQLFAKFESVGAAGNPTAEDIKMLNEWLANPVASLDPYSPGYPGQILLGDRIFSASLYDNGGSPGYCDLFSSIAQHAIPPLAVSNLSQTSDATIDVVTEEIQAEMGDVISPEERSFPILRVSDAGWKVSYTLDGVTDVLHIYGDSTWLNDIGLISEFDALLTRLGRQDRVIKFGKTRGDSSFSGSYIVTDRTSFVPLCQELAIPLELPISSIGNAG